MDNKIKEAKAKLRAEMREISKNIKDRSQQDKNIIFQATGTPYFSQATTAFVFIGSGHEPDTRPIIEEAFDRGMHVCVPKIIGDGIMVPVEIKSYDELVPGKFGILTAPEGAREVRLEEIQVAFVPGLAFDKKACRLGRGGGYYDRFVDECYAITIGLCYDEQIVAEVPREAHDRTLDFVFSGTIGGIWG